jgi:beta-mannosidase
MIETEWTYKTQFTDRNTLEKEYINLHFEGIDTYASYFTQRCHYYSKPDNAFTLENRRKPHT